MNAKKRIKNKDKIHRKQFVVKLVVKGTPSKIPVLLNIGLKLLPLIPRSIHKLSEKSQSTHLRTIKSAMNNLLNINKTKRRRQQQK